MVGIRTSTSQDVTHCRPAVAMCMYGVWEVCKVVSSYAIGWFEDATPGAWGAAGGGQGELTPVIDRPGPQCGVEGLMGEQNGCAGWLPVWRVVVGGVDDVPHNSPKFSGGSPGQRPSFWPSVTASLDNAPSSSVVNNNRRRPSRCPCNTTLPDVPCTPSSTTPSPCLSPCPLRSCSNMSTLSSAAC